MDTVSIRNLRGAALRERALSGQPFAITNHRLLIGVVIPVAAAWVENLIDQNWSRVRQSVAEGEEDLAAGAALVTLENAMTEADAAGFGGGEPGALAPGQAERLAVPLVMAAAGGTLAHEPGAEEAIERLRAAWSPAAAGEGVPSVRTVRIGDLSARVIEQAGLAGQTLALTHNRELIGIVIPVTPELVHFLIEQNMSRVLYNIRLAEKQLTTPDKLTTLDEALSEADGGTAQPSPPLAARLPGE